VRTALYGPPRYARYILRAHVRVCIITVRASGKDALSRREGGERGRHPRNRLRFFSKIANERRETSARATGRRSDAAVKTDNDEVPPPRCCSFVIMISSPATNDRSSAVVYVHALCAPPPVAACITNVFPLSSVRFSAVLRVSGNTERGAKSEQID